MMNQRPDISRGLALTLCVLVLFGAMFIRANGAAHTPPGLAFDSTWDLADALRISRGISFPADFDTRSEPAHRWMLALALLLWGPNAFSAQVLQIFIAVITVALTYAAARILLRGQSWRRVGAVIAAGVIASIVQHIFISRIAYHAILVAPVVALTLATLLRAARTDNGKLWILGGFVAALGVHTYQAGIPTPFWALGFVGHQLIFARKRLAILGQTLLGMLPPLAVWLMLIALVPNLFFRIHAAGGNTPYSVGRFLGGYVGAFREMFFTGYSIPLYGTPNTPFLNPVFALLAVLGCGVMLRRWRTAESALLLGGLAIFILPAGLSEDPTHPVRLIGTMPLLGILAGWGTVWLCARVVRPELRRALAGVTAILVTVSMAASLATFNGMFSDPTEYGPPDGWNKIPHNYIIALVDGLTLLEHVDKPTYVPLGVLDTPAANFILQRQAFPNVTTWARFGLTELPDGQFFLPVYDYYHVFTHTDDPCRALLLPAEHTIVILPCDLNAPLSGSGPVQSIQDTWGWDVAHISPFAKRPLITPTLDLKNAATMGSGLQLAGQQIAAQADGSAVGPGQTADILLYWHVNTPQPTDIYSVVQLLDTQFGRYANSDQHVLPYLYPSARWQPGDVIPDRHLLDIPRDLPNGLYRWGTGVYVLPSTKRLAITPTDSYLDDLWLWGALRLPSPANGTIPLTAKPLNVRFDDHILLTGYQLNQMNAEWTLTLYWRVDGPPQGDYTIFVHAQAGDKLIAQQDGKPLNGTLPTWAWQPGEVVTTTHTLAIPDDAAPTSLYIGLYIYPSLQRLGVQQDGQPNADQQALIWRASGTR